jgi:uncharacterized protein (DUF697 family)
MRSLIGRLIAIVAAAIVTFLADTLGLEVTPEASEAITDGLNLLGTGLFFVGYASFHKFVNHWLAPADSAGQEPLR